MSRADALLYAFGVDPGVYRPMLRAQQRILARRNRLARGTGRIVVKGFTPFLLRCLMYTVFSVMLLSWILGSSPLFGVALALTAGAMLLLFDLLFDKVDFLANADEYQVIAAHPHDAWSVLLAKVMALASEVGALGACLFMLPAIATGFAFHSVGAGIAFAGAAAALTAAVSMGGMLASAVIVATGGRRALLRFLPAVHATYLLLYFGVYYARKLVAHMTVPSLDALGWLRWALPSVWFVAPVEFASGHVGPTTAARGALALASTAVLLPISARWVRTRFDERILEPAHTASHSRNSARRTSRRVSVAPSRNVGMLAYRKILMAHLRSDTTVRSALLMSVFMPAMLLVSQTFATGLRAESLIAMALTWLFLAETYMVRGSLISSHPSGIWFVLLSPGARVPFSRALEVAVRLVTVMPTMAIAAVYVSLAGSGPLWTRLALVTLVGILADTGILVLRITTPDLPFSRPIRSKRPFSWALFPLWLGTFAWVGILLGGFILLQRAYPALCFVPVLSAASGWVGARFWERRVVERTARSAEGYGSAD